jgi:hypothetical protein
LDLVRSVLSSTYAAKARGVALCAITVGTAYVYYLAVDAEDAIPPAAADVIPDLPVVRIAPVSQPTHIIPGGPTRELPAVRVSEQTGNIQASQATADQLTNGALRAPGPFIVADASETPSSSQDEEQNQARFAMAVHLPTQISESEALDAPADDRSMLDHPWARPEMLVPPHDMASADNTATPIAGNADATERHAAPETVTGEIPRPAPAPIVKVSARADGDSALHFDGGRVLAETSHETAVPSAPAETADPSVTKTKPVKAAQRKAKTAKRRARTTSSSYDMSFDSIQRSLSSLFD